MFDGFNSLLVYGGKIVQDIIRSGLMAAGFNQNTVNRGNQASIWSWISTNVKSLFGFCFRLTKTIYSSGA
jgi:hypothetical protein